MFLTCAGVCVLAVDLQEDERREDQQPADRLVRGLLQRGPPALGGREQDPAAAAQLGVRWVQGGGEGAGGEAAGCLQRPQGHREGSGGG